MSFALPPSVKRIAVSGSAVARFNTSSNCGYRLMGKISRERQSSVSTVIISGRLGETAR